MFRRKKKLNNMKKEDKARHKERARQMNVLGDFVQQSVLDLYDLDVEIGMILETAGNMFKEMIIARQADVEEYDAVCKVRREAIIDYNETIVNQLTLKKDAKRNKKLDN